MSARGSLLEPMDEALVLTLENRARLRARHLARVARYAAGGVSMALSVSVLEDTVRLLDTLAERAEAAP